MKRGDLLVAIDEGRVIATYGYGLNGGFTRPVIPDRGGVYTTKNEADKMIASSPADDGVMMSSKTWIVPATREMVNEMADWMVELTDGPMEAI